MPAVLLRYCTCIDTHISTRTHAHTHTHTQTYTHSLYDPNFTSVCTHKRHESRILKRYLYTHVHSSIICNSQRWKQSKGLSKDEWKSKIWYIHTIEYHSALRKKKGLITLMVADMSGIVCILGERKCKRQILDLWAGWTFGDTQKILPNLQMRKLKVS